MHDSEFLSLLPSRLIYHRYTGVEATVETAPQARTIRIFGQRAPSEFAVQIKVKGGTRRLLFGGAQARDWCLTLEDTDGGPERVEQARRRAQKIREEQREWDERLIRQKRERLIKRRRLADPNCNTDDLVCLRCEHTYHALAQDDVKETIIRLGLFDKLWNPAGRFKKDYRTHGNPVTVTEHRTGLMWQRNVHTPSVRSVPEWIDQIDWLNDSCFGGFRDWRVPTLEEAGSLLEPGPNEWGFYLDPVFGSPPSPYISLLGHAQLPETRTGPSPPYWILTTDAAPGTEPYEELIWCVDLLEGRITETIFTPQVLACRSISATELATDNGPASG